MAVRTSITKDDDYQVESLHVDEKGEPSPLQDDPDAGLSPEERQKRVRYGLESWTLSDTDPGANRIANYCGSSTST